MAAYPMWRVCVLFIIIIIIIIVGACISQANGYYNVWAAQINFKRENRINLFLIYALWVMWHRRVKSFEGRREDRLTRCGWYCILLGCSSFGAFYGSQMWPLEGVWMQRLVSWNLFRVSTHSSQLFTRHQGIFTVDQQPMWEYGSSA